LSAWTLSTGTIIRTSRTSWLLLLTTSWNVGWNTDALVINNTTPVTVFPTPLTTTFRVNGITSGLTALVTLRRSPT